MNNQEKQDIWKKKIIELKDKIRELNSDKSILINLLNEAKEKKIINLDNPLYDIELQEKISYINDWIEFYLKGIRKYENKLRLLGRNKEELGGSQKEKGAKASEEESIQGSFELIFSEAEEGKPKAEIKAPEIKSKEQPIERAKRAAAEKIINIREKTKEFKAKKPLFAYALPFAVLLLIIAGLFLLKPAITGYVASSKETTYNENLNLKINESGNYTWNLTRAGEIKSITATGSFSGNGTVKIYIEKDGKRYLIFDNKGK